MPDPSDIILPVDLNDPAFLLRRSPSGDYVRAGVEGVETALRWDMEIPESIFEALFLSQPVGYDSIQIWWGVPPEGLANWTSMAVVRSGFGHPSTPSDGEIVYQLKRPPPNSTDPIPGTFFDGPAGPVRQAALPSGRWFYYTLFFRIAGRWITAGTTASLVPVDYRHREHLLGLVPPFYLAREAEDSTSFLTRWMTMIGYDLDYTRTLAEGVQQIYDPDSSPQVLIDAMGQQNLGFKKPSALGDIRYRSVLANNRAILFHRGTASGLETYVESVFKSEVMVSSGMNELLLVDDAEFYSGVGNWCPMPWRMGYRLADGTRTRPPAPPLLPMNAMKTRHVKIEPFVQRDDGRPDCPPVLTGPTAPWPLPTRLASARGVARIQAPAGEHLAITCGAGQQDVIVGVDSEHQQLRRDRRHLDAYYRGIPVEEETTYYMSFWSRREPGNTTEQDLVFYGLAQYGREPTELGFSDGFRAVKASNPLNTRAGFDGWQVRTTSGSPPQTMPIYAYYAFFNDPWVGGSVGNTVDATVTLGTQFSTLVPVVITHIRYYRAGGSPGPHYGTIWDANTQENLLTVPLDDSTNTQGWVSTSLGAGLPMAAGRQFIVTYHCPHGWFLYTDNVWPPPPNTYTNYPLVAHGGRSTFGAAGGPPAFPVNPTQASYFADVTVRTEQLVPVAVTELPIKEARRLVRTGAGSDGWEHHVASFHTDKDCRYVIPFIWFHQTAKDANLHPLPINTPRYITGLMVNKAQGGGADQVFLPDDYLKLLNQTAIEPDKHRIGTVDEKYIGGR